MTPDLINSPLAIDLIGRGMPAVVAVRAAVLLNNRRHDYLDAATTVKGDQTIHEVVVVTDRRIIEVCAKEVGESITVYVARAWARRAIVSVDASGSDEAWAALTQGGAVAGEKGLRRYRLIAESPQSFVTVPLSPAGQDEADDLVARLACEIA